MNKKKVNFDCPQCGQDLRLSPDAKDEIEIAREEGRREGIPLIERLLERMKMINGDHKNCVGNPFDCPNHALINETEQFLKSHQDGGRFENN